MSKKILSILVILVSFGLFLKSYLNILEIVGGISKLIDISNSDGTKAFLAFLIIPLLNIVITPLGVLFLIIITIKNVSIKKSLFTNLFAAIVILNMVSILYPFVEFFSRVK